MATLDQYEGILGISLELLGEVIRWFEGDDSGDTVGEK